MRRKLLASRHFISIAWSCLCVLVLVSCGPCAGLRRSFDARWRFELQHIALGDRVDVGMSSHARLLISPEALQVISSVALKETDAFTRAATLQVPNSSWSREGVIHLEMDIRLDSISSAERLDYFADQEVELTLSTMVQARFEIPGKRARWSWNARSVVRASLVLDDAEEGAVGISFQDAELVAVDARLPWIDEDVPADVRDIVYNGIASSVEAVLLENQNTTVTVLRIGTLNLSRANLPVRVSSIHVEEETGVVELGFVTALRPVARSSEQTSTRVQEVPAYGVALIVPVETLDAAMRQQSLRGATPMSITLDDEDDRGSAKRWTALWGNSRIVDGMWAGTWDLWCLDAPPCRHRRLRSKTRAFVSEGIMVTERDRLPQAFEDAGTSSTSSAASLAELQRLTVAEFTMGTVRWLLRVAPTVDMRAEMDSVEFAEDAFRAVFFLR